MKRYQNSPWYVKIYRRCRYMPIMYIKMCCIILWWIVTGAKPQYHFSRLRTLGFLKNWYVSMCHYDMGYWYTTDEALNRYYGGKNENS